VASSLGTFALLVCVAAVANDSGPITDPLRLTLVVVGGGLVYFMAVVVMGTLIRVRPSKPLPKEY
jgi:hypothetical protein